MAKMIPPYLHGNTPPGERLVFSHLRDDPGTRDWVVLHSLWIARHLNRTEGEVDFVLLVPGEGVLCLEVKSGKVSRKEGVWKYGEGPSALCSKVGPFRQASEGMHSIRKFISQRDPSLSKLIYFSGVIFTLIDFDEISPEWHSWQYVDRSRLTKKPVSQMFISMLRSAAKHFEQTSSAKWYDSRQSKPSEIHIEKLTNILRPDFECYVSPRIEIDNAETSIYSFTKEQFAALDVLEENPRVLFKGLAGTGKTFLALEAARRILETGRSVFFTCYNSMLSKWLQKEISGLSSKHGNSLTASSFHQFLLSVSKIREEIDSSSEFWAAKLPGTVIDGILEGKIDIPQYDFLIIDEAQDLIAENYLDIFDLLLKGGLAGGKWAFFGDFEWQSIYLKTIVKDSKTLLQLLQDRCPTFFRFPLRNNCRNSLQIAVGMEITCGLQPGYSRILNQSGDMNKIETVFYRDSTDQATKLESILVDLKSVYRTNEIVILSPREDKAACALRLKTLPTKLKLYPFRNGLGKFNGIAYGTIHSFKGLESPAIVITDIERVAGETMLELLYVGMSRARTRLVILINHKRREEYLGILKKGLFRTKKQGEVND